MSGGAQLVVLGSVNTDLIFRVTSLPRPGETVADATFEQRLGGKGANQAVAAARAGLRVALIARVGDDAEGLVAIELLAAEGIDVSHCRTIPGARTGRAAVLVARDGTNEIAVAPLANSELPVDAVAAAESQIAAAEAFLTQLEIPARVAHAGLAAARRVGTTSVLNASPAMKRWDRSFECDVLVVNRHEAEALLGLRALPAPALATELASHTASSAVLVTDGAAGAGARGGGTTHQAPSKLVHAVDSTGAGDAFLGAFLAASVEGWELEEALGFAVAAGGLAVTRPGAIDALPSRSEIAAAVLAN